MTYTSSKETGKTTKLSTLNDKMQETSHLDELVARINHANLMCNSFAPTRFRDWTHHDDSLCILIEAIGDYLMRVVGSVPIRLRIVLRGEKVSLLSAFKMTVLCMLHLNPAVHIQYDHKIFCMRLNLLIRF